MKRVGESRPDGGRGGFRLTGPGEGGDGRCSRRWCQADMRGLGTAGRCSDVNGTAVYNRASPALMCVNHAVAHRFSADSFTHRVAA